MLTFKALLSDIDASIWLSPEYNFTITSVLKNAIEHAPSGRAPRRRCAAFPRGSSAAAAHWNILDG
ncbi:hypothetical protein HC891_01580 [Candidatus Gracilibacteria bacterium]|nr:hypothetical protein [Candidatus Gracilibacteria bacterium]